MSLINCYNSTTTPPVITRLMGYENLSRPDIRALLFEYSGSYQEYFVSVKRLDPVRFNLNPAIPNFEVIALGTL